MMKKKEDKFPQPQTQSVDQLTEVSILLDSYDDIFSDFDPNPYHARSLSDDFIIDAKKFYSNKSGNKMLLKLLLPLANRNELEEKVIVKRLHEYFKSVHHQLATAVKKTIKIGLLLTIIGISLMFAASYISFMRPVKYHMHLLLVLFEPAGWFLLWAGLDHLVYFSKKKKKDLRFYSKMTNSEIKFFTYLEK